MQRSQAAMLPDGRRLHLQHGPIDLIVEVFGAGRDAAYLRAAQRFESVLDELVAELSQLRAPLSSVGVRHLTPNLSNLRFESPIARRMQTAVMPFAAEFITPMAAVAGAVADEILAEIACGQIVQKAYVNNGGDIAIHLAPEECFAVAIASKPPARTQITSDMGIGGIATSGWHGRSHSFGIADSVTVLAPSSAAADAAATMIANAVDLPGHDRIERAPARDLAPDSDLEGRLVTTVVPLLSSDEKTAALRNGMIRAKDYLDRRLICAAYLTLQGETRVTASRRLLTAFKETADV